MLYIHVTIYSIYTNTDIQKKRIKEEERRKGWGRGGRVGAGRYLSR